MKLSVTKGQAFLYVHSSLYIMAMICVYKDSMPAFWSQLIAAMVTNGAAFIAGNVADNGVKGKFYNDGLKK
jgi:hypothetical protein